MRVRNWVTTTDPARQESMEKWPALAKAVDSGVESHDGREARLLTWIYAHPSLNQMRGSPSAILAAIDHFAGQEEFLINLGEDKAQVMAGIVKKEMPKTSVEIGGYIGYSAILIADAMCHTYPDAKAGDIRLWNLELDLLFASIAMNLVDLAGLSEFVKIVTGPASESLERLKDERKLTKIGMLLLDHVEELYVQEFKTCERLGLLSEGSVIIADNVVRPGAPQYRGMVRSHPGLKSEGIRGLIMPGGFEDELEFSRVREPIN